MCRVPTSAIVKKKKKKRPHVGETNDKAAELVPTHWLTRALLIK